MLCDRSMFTKTTLKNGLRIILAPTKGTKTVTVLLMVGTGSKYETKDINGVSHFLEHMFFKGTKKRPSTLAIAEELDRVGGAYNAFTSKEYTGYWAKVASSHLDLALDVISDIFLNSSLKENEINKEKKVITQEINMYQDTPQNYVGMLFEKLLYKDQPAGWSVLGTKKVVNSLRREQILNYLKKYYTSLNTVICLAGNVKKVQSARCLPARAFGSGRWQAGKVQSYIDRYFKGIKVGECKSKKKVVERQMNPQSQLHYKKTDQSHFCLGVRTYDLFNPRRYALKLLSTILGGNMSSRLFISVRVKEGLAYYISTDSEFYTDTGYLVTQAGIDNKKVKKAIRIILREYQKMAKTGVGEKELVKAKDYIKGRTLISLESSDGLSSWLCTQELLRGKINTLKEEFAKIDKVTPKDIQEVAQDIFVSKKLNLALIGPFRDKREFDRLLTI